MSEHAEGRTWSDPRLIVKGRPRWGIMGVEEGVKSTAIPLSPVAGGSRFVFNGIIAGQDTQIHAARMNLCVACV